MWNRLENTTLKFQLELHYFASYSGTKVTLKWIEKTTAQVEKHFCGKFFFSGKNFQFCEQKLRSSVYLLTIDRQMLEEHTVKIWFAQTQ